MENKSLLTEQEHDRLNELMVKNIESDLTDAESEEFGILSGLWMMEIAMSEAV